MTFGAVGDIHGDFSALYEIMSRHPEAAFWVCPGDVANDAGEYPRPLAPLYWSKGNNENFDFIAREVANPGAVPNLHYIPNGVAVKVRHLTLAGIGGTLAPTWYDTKAEALPAATGRSRRDDKRRHFVREEIEACRKLRGIDLFLSHEAARPFIVGGPGPRRMDAGKKPINEVLADVQPRLHLFGHHHRFTESVRENVRSVGLDRVTASYLLLQFDGESLEYEYWAKV
jgi:hypothetical protein